MADERPVPEDAAAEGRRIRTWAHDWHSFEDYLAIHDSSFEKLRRAGVLLNDALSFQDAFVGGTLAAIEVTGLIECGSNVVIDVAKTLDVRTNRRNRLEVKGVFYIYHATHAPSGRSLFRYCTAHGLDDLHVHRFDNEGNETAQPRIPLDQLPSLTDAILEAVDLVAVLKP